MRSNPRIESTTTTAVSTDFSMTRFRLRASAAGGRTEPGLTSPKMSWCSDSVIFGFLFHYTDFRFQL